MRKWLRAQWEALPVGRRAALGLLLILPGGLVLFGLAVLVALLRGKRKGVR